MKNKLDFKKITAILSGRGQPSQETLPANRIFQEKGDSKTNLLNQEFFHDFYVN